jgi:hypothetical protein
MTWVWERGPANGTERMLLLALADHCDDAGHAYPSMAGLASKACVTERGARLIMRRLESGGWVKTKVGGGRGGKSQYQILMENPERQTGNDKPGIANPEPERAKPGTSVHKPGTVVPPNHHEPSREPSKISYAGAHEPLVPLIGEDLAVTFLEHRKALKAPLTERAARIIAKKLAGMPNPAAAVEQSITRGWRDVFPVKAEILPLKPEKADGRPSRSDQRLDAFLRGAAG